MRDTLVVPPIVLSESGDVDVFESIEDAEKYVEPIDVKSGRLVAFDAEGRLLLLHPTTPRVTIELAEDTPTHAEELSRLLKRFLGQVGVPQPELQSWSLADLVLTSLNYKVR